MSTIIDISMVLTPESPTFPGDPPVTFEAYLDVERAIRTGRPGLPCSTTPAPTSMHRLIFCRTA